MKITCIVGIRPNFVKIAPVTRELANMPDVDLTLIHTGQHYDYRMSKLFFEELDIPDPDINLEVGSGTHASQTAHMLMKLEPALENIKPDTVVVAGDGNSTLAGALAAAKMHLPVCHIEAGLRSYDMMMPEEINRRLTDHISSLLFTPTKNASQNLLAEGLPKPRIHNCGDTMVDSLRMMRKRFSRSNITERAHLKRGEYAVLTCHRSENVDNQTRLSNIIHAITALRTTPIVFPVHPHTKQRITQAGLWEELTEADHIVITEPLGYLDMLALMQRSRLVITDSGGIQKEAFLLHIPCVTLRLNTEWVETIQAGVNMLAGWKSTTILSAVKCILKTDISRGFKRAKSPFGTGNASREIAQQIHKALRTKQLTVPTSDMLHSRLATHRTGIRH